VPGRQTERFLTTVLFTDIVGSTEVAAELGDRGWRELVQEHHRIVRDALRRHGGREMDTAGDGFFAVFDAPAEAAASALDAIEAVRALGIEIRAGLHVGEVEQMGAKVGGITVPTAARIMASAGGSELLVSSTVRDLAAGSGLRFEDRGERALKGVPGEWRLYAVTRTGGPAGPTSEAEQGKRRAAAVRRAEARPIWQKHPRLTAAVAIGLAAVMAAGGTLAWSPWQPKALAGVAENSIGVVDPSRNVIVAATSVDAQPGGIAVSNGAVWVTNTGSNTVSHLDPKSRSVVDSIDVGKSPVGITVGAGAVWVANSGERSVSRIDPRTGRVTATIAVGNGPLAVAFGAGGVWVANTGDGTVLRIDPTTGTAGKPVSVGALPDSLAVDDHGLWVASQDGATVSHLDPTTGAALTAPIPVGTHPAAIVIGGGSVWVANQGDGTVSRIDPATDRVIGLVTVGGAPTSLAFDGRNLWVADGLSGVERVDTTNLSAPPVRVSSGTPPQAIAVVNGEIWFASRPSLASHRGGTLRVVSEGIQIDPDAFSTPEFESLIGDSLVAYRRVGGIAGSQLRPGLALALPKPTDGGLTYTFHLRPNLTYSDGHPVKASDFVLTFERVFKASDADFGNLGGSFYANLVGADACLKEPKTCDVSKAVVPDDAANTVTFHLATPDPDFLYKLSMTFANVMETGTVPADAFATKPFPGTGPYMIASVTSTVVRLVRNPHFRSWDLQLRPAGYADEIVWRSGVKPADQVRMVQSGAADFMDDQIPADAFAQLETRYAPQLHLAAQSTTFMFLNTKLPPFNNLDVRHAVNFAVDRAAVAELRGGTGVTAPTCQVLPPNFPGYQPYCPYTKDPAPNGGGKWSGPDLVKARALVAQSGLAGTRIVVGPFVPRLTPVAGYAVRLLRGIGFTNVSEVDATDGPQVFKAIFQDKTVQVGAFELIQDYPGPDTYLAGFTCSESDGLSNFCDPALDALVKQARDLQQTDPAAAADTWSQVDRKVTDLALWVPMVNEGSDFVSARLGNYQYNLAYGILLDQAWIK
jgi:YVTN family beta-propeller protein